MKKVELTLSESFHKHKRNLLLLCSAITVLRLASPTKLKLPFVSTDVDLPARIAFALLGISLIYMFSQYFIEYRTMLARHSSSVIDSPNDTVDEMISGHLRQMTGWVNTIYDQIDVNNHVQRLGATLSNQKIVDEIDDGLKRLNHLLTDRNAYRRDEGLPSYDDTHADDPRHMMAQFEHVTKDTLTRDQRTKDAFISEVRDRLQNVERSQALIQDKLSEYSSRYGDVARQFKKLSKSINAAQRVGFTIIDGIFVHAFAAGALVASVTGVAGWWLPLAVVASK